MTYYQQKKSAFSDSQKGNAYLSVAIIFGLFLLIVLYLTQINSVVAKNFELRSARNSLKARQDVNQQMIIALMQVRSMVNLESAAKNLNLVAVEKINYLKIASEFFVLSQKP
ncbi:hypothetical protein KJ866_00655 [Patescibacteria group bacterium]|nr:hypothetical protein [Patescibacteria group bacterium]MBU2219794.1 hypothetical protein [Patescibacteria group bacterium]MBU2265301.1 hypothetical protein [Patescibacteria group bacterium]